MFENKDKLRFQAKGLKYKNNSYDIFIILFICLFILNYDTFPNFRIFSLNHSRLLVCLCMFLLLPPLPTNSQTNKNYFIFFTAPTLFVLTTKIIFNLWETDSQTQSQIHRSIIQFTILSKKTNTTITYSYKL